MIRLSLIAATLAGAATVAGASDLDANMTAYLDQNIRPWMQDATLVDAIVAQNARHEGLSQAEIEEMDLAWRAEVGAAQTPTIDAVVGNAAADYLRAQIAEAGGTMTEVFIMDMVGLNVASTGVTSDMWQGDEAKFSETYGVGPEAVHFSEIEFDESSQSYQVQISVPVLDPASGDLIGALTVGVNAETLM